MRPKKSDVSKKPYKTPILVIHGTVKELTRAVGIRGTADGGTRFRIRTKL
ncbi:MAG: lasso RiPP family leader peptide-containing protein [Terriglobales bacterium]